VPVMTLAHTAACSHEQAVLQQGVEHADHAPSLFNRSSCVECQSPVLVRLYRWGRWTAYLHGNWVFAAAIETSSMRLTASGMEISSEGIDP